MTGKNLKNIQIKCVCKPGAKLPQYQTAGAAGADLHAFLDEPVILKPMERKAIPTGIFIEIPEGYEVQVRPRSGLALKNGITCLNSPGTVDSDYRGELKTILINLGSEDFEIKNGDRIAQMVVAPVIQAEYKIVAELSSTERAEGGFGSTGK